MIVEILEQYLNAANLFIFWQILFEDLGHLQKELVHPMGPLQSIEWFLVKQCNMVRAQHLSL
jgi:hypothetical protein